MNEILDILPMLRDLKELEETEPFNRGIVRMADEPEETDTQNDEY